MKVPEPSRQRRRAATQLTAIGLEFSGSVIGGLALGYYLDEWLGTEPWLLLVGTFGGLGAAVLRMVQLLKKYAPPRSDEPPSPG
jgi:F0F1-type ATP synthase assembly protein I